MTISQSRALIDGIIIGLKKAKELFRESTDAKGGCHLLSVGEDCRCFLCLCDSEVRKAEEVQKSEYTGGG